MADPLSVTSALVGIVTGAVQASRALYKTVESFRNHPRNVRLLREELEALIMVLQSLAMTAGRDASTLTSLRRPLERCQQACVDFRIIMIECSRRSGSRTSFRDWAAMKYMGSDIAGFTNMLAGYKSTITIALGDANLRSAYITLEALNEYKRMIQTTTDDLEEHLNDIDSKLQALSSQSVGGSTDMAADLQRIQAEKDSTQQCIEIVTSISAQIDQIRFQPIFNSPTLGNPPTAGLEIRDLTRARVMTLSALKDCSDKLVDTAACLQDHIKTTSQDLAAQSQSDLEGSAEVVAERLQRERDSAQQRLVFCNEASDRASTDRVHIVENISAADDGQQYFVSTVGDLFRVKGVSAGSGSFQFFGSTSDDTLQKLLELQVRK